MAARRSPGPGPALLLVLAVLGPGRPLRGVRAALNLQELSELKYGLEILAEPVLAGQRPAGEVVTVASRFRQRYECRLPPAALRRPPAPRPPPAYNGSGVPELLRPLAAQPCLLKTKDWWTYEFCYGKHIQQYHLEESEIKGDILFLGYYHSAFDWEDEAARASKQHLLKRYHSQSYLNGSLCDLTGRPREAEVRFLCEEGAGDYLARVDEPQSCSYVLTVHSARLCLHPALRPPPSAPQPIRCQPALSPAQYGLYLQAQVSDTQRQVELLSEELRSLDSRLPPPGTAAAGTAAAGGAQQQPGREVASGQAVPSRAGGQQGSAQGSAQGGQPPEPPGGGRAWGSFPSAPQAAEPRPKAAAGAQGSAPPGQLRLQLLRSPGALQRLLQELRDSSPQAKGKVRKEEEEEEEEEQEPPPAPQEPPPGEGEAAAPRGGSEEQLRSQAQPQPEGLKGDQAPGPDPQGQGEEEEEEEGEEGAGGGGRRRQSPGGGPGGGPRPGGAGGGAPQRPAAARLRLRSLERQLQELLAQGGLRAEGKIEIKIVSAGGAQEEEEEEEGEEEEEEGQWLSEEDTKSLKEIFFNILLQGSEEAQQEQRRQQALEANYRFVWGGRGEPPPAADLEDPDL